MLQHIGSTYSNQQSLTICTSLSSSSDEKEEWTEEDMEFDEEEFSKIMKEIDDKGLDEDEDVFDDDYFDDED